jgi:hypothetical protein
MNDLALAADQGESPGAVGPFAHDKDDGVNPPYHVPVPKSKQKEVLTLFLLFPKHVLICLPAGKFRLSPVQICVAGSSFRHRIAINPICKGNSSCEVGRFALKL